MRHKKARVFTDLQLLERTKSNGVFNAGIRKSGKSIRKLCLKLLENGYLSGGEYASSAKAYRYRLTNSGKAHLEQLIEERSRVKQTYTYRARQWLNTNGNATNINEVNRLVVRFSEQITNSDEYHSPARKDLNRALKLLRDAQKKNY